MLLRYENGATRTTEELAKLIREEGKLIIGIYSITEENTRLRCAFGVIEEWENGTFPVRLIANSWAKLWKEINIRYNVANGIISVNDNFVGTPEERMEYIASILEALPE